MNLKLALISPSDNLEARGSSSYDTIILTVPHIYKDCNSNFDEFIKGIIYIYAVEFVCSHITEGKWVEDYVDPENMLCYDREYCPIAEIIRKNGYMYDMGLSRKDFIF